MPFFGIGWTQHWGMQGSYDKDVCAIFHPLLEVTSLKKHVCVKDSSAEGTCWSKIRKIVAICHNIIISTTFELETFAIFIW